MINLITILAIIAFIIVKLKNKKQKKTISINASDEITIEMIGDNNIFPKLIYLIQQFEHVSIQFFHNKNVGYLYGE